MARGDGSEACRSGELELIAARQAGAACAGGRELREHSPSVGNHFGGRVGVDLTVRRRLEIGSEMDGCCGRGVEGGCGRGRYMTKGWSWEVFASPGALACSHVTRRFSAEAHFFS
jgi:hypothetical protein